MPLKASGLMLTMHRLMAVLLLWRCTSPGHAFLCAQGRAHPKGRICLSTSSRSEDEARRLQEEAERIRAEIASFEQQKEEVARKEEWKQEQIKSEQQNKRMRYSAEVPILKGDGSTVVERVDFPPRIKDGAFHERMQHCVLFSNEGKPTKIFHLNNILLQGLQESKYAPLICHLELS